MVVAGEVGIELYGRVALALEAERRSALHCRWLENRASRPKKWQNSLAMLMITNVLSDISRDSA
jgi:hypothetical protein